MNEIDALLILNAIPGLGPNRLKKLLQQFGSAGKIFTSGVRELTAEGVISAGVAENILSFAKEDYLRQEYVLLKKHNVKIVTHSEGDYPKNLKEIPGAPLVLYVKGVLKPEQILAVGMVGSRQASVYGSSTAEKFATELSELGITIVSGLAKGIDTAAHRGALRAKGATLAVLGCGLAQIYPKENIRLAEEIIVRGALISEFGMTMPPLAQNFPQRNRIISGLSLGIIVVEASAKSGALITSNFALEQGREVFAVPGKIDNPNAIGVNNLIKQGAKLVSGVQDVLEELAPQLKLFLSENKNSVPQEHAAPAVPLTEQEKTIYDHLTGIPAHVDQIAEQCGHSMRQIMSILLQLELKGLVKQLPGKLFIR
ncbi:MAG: DNA protecting protein DprA [Omnitrophica WOR_2 bacterium RIFCSPHIGHO2_02_FULL_48_11]|nr:MAG: DNA protecting protein DprA [Omnitrophica WOR_2 bacterium RIFCSPHIGHO2_02_FULL_48_11]